MKRVVLCVLTVAAVVCQSGAQTVNYTPPPYVLMTSASGNPPFSPLATASGIGAVQYTPPNLVVPMCSATGLPPYSQCTFGGGGTTTNALTAAATGGAAPGSTFNGAAAVTFDWHSFGAQKALSLLAGTYADGDVCTYTASGTLLNCNTPVPAAVTFAGDLSGDNTSQTVVGINGAAPPTDGNLGAWSQDGRAVQPTSGTLAALTVTGVNDPGTPPTSTGATAGGTVGASNFNYAVCQVLLYNPANVGGVIHSDATPISSAVVTTSPDQTIPWVCPIVVPTQSSGTLVIYVFVFCQGSSCTPNYNTNVLGTNTFTQTLPPSGYTPWTPVTGNDTGTTLQGPSTAVTQSPGDNSTKIATMAALHGDLSPTSLTPSGPVYSAPLFSNGTCTTAATITPANGNNQAITLTDADACALTFTQPSSGTANIVLEIIQDASVTTGGTITGCLWPAGVVPVITPTNSAVDIVNVFLDGTNAYCFANQNFM